MNERGQHYIRKQFLVRQLHILPLEECFYIMGMIFKQEAYHVG